METTYQISLEDITKLIDHMSYLKNQLANMWQAPGLSTSVSLLIFKGVGQMKAIEDELILERSRLPIPEEGAGE
ncbi:hypothetical protein ES702_03936 [subsurface metagenome]